MRSLFAMFLGCLLLFAPWTSFALSVPPQSPVISPYAQALLTYAQTFLGSASSSGPLSPCSPGESQADATRALAAILLDIEAVQQAEKDIERSVCLRHDAEALEQFIRALVDQIVQSAAVCDNDARSHYEAMVRFLWGHLVQLRRFGLDPRTQAPVLGAGSTDIPSSATSAGDDALCPYHSAYAEPVFGGLGCHLPLLPSSASPRLTREATLLNQIVQRMDIGSGLALELSMFRNVLEQLWNHAASFVSDVSIRRPPRLPTFAPLPLVPALPFNVGESGCRGWPSSAGGVVTGSDVPLQTYFPLVLTRELAEVIAYLRDQGVQPGFAYITAPASGADFSYRTDLGAENEHHLRIELFSMLSHIDPQLRMTATANRLHERTRDFVRLAVLLPGESGMPPLRSFTQQYALFLARMCMNRGCGSTLKRAMELSLRDECFLSFLMDVFFRDHPSERTLPVCRSLYVP